MEQIRANGGLSPADIELLIQERSKGKSLRQLGLMFDRSYERVRQLLAKHDASGPTLLSESRVAAELGCPPWWVVRLRREGNINPIKPAHIWFYSEEQVRQVRSIIAEGRRCQQCGKPRPLWSHAFCEICRQDRIKTRYMRLSPEKKAEHLKKCMAWQKAPRKMTKTKETCVNRSLPRN